MAGESRSIDRSKRPTHAARSVRQTHASHTAKGSTPSGGGGGWKRTAEREGVGLRGPVGDKAIKSDRGEGERGPTSRRIRDGERGEQRETWRERARQRRLKRDAAAPRSGAPEGCGRKQERGKGCCVCWHGPVRQRLLPHTNRRNYS